MEVIISQAGIIDFIGTHPQIPTLFVANVGTAIPIANTIELLGAAVAAHGVPLQTVASGNTVDFNIQYASAAASSIAGNAGVASFNSAFFTVDASGFVSISGGSILESFTVDASTPPGTNPVVPNISGIVTVTGGQVAAGSTTNVIRTNSLAANTYTIQIQRSQAVASSTVGDNGVSHFDSGAFSVDSNGFVQLKGGGTAATSFQVQANTAPGTNPVVPTAAGLVNVNGAVVANHSVVLETRSRAVNTYNVEVQYSAAAASTDGTKSGVAHFNSGQFSVDASGFVSLAGGGQAIDSFQPDSGTNPVVPDTNGLVVMAGSGSTTTVGGLNTLTFQLTGLTNHAVLVGAGTTTITKIAATANTGAVLQNNSGADPSYSTATYPSTTTVSQILYSSATNVVSGLATANRAVLTTGATGVPVLTALATDGQLIIGSTAGAPAAATLTAGTGITITNGSNSITISASTSGFTWTDVTGATQTLAAENGYVTDRSGGVTYTLPASGTLGDTIKIVGKLGLAVITPNANQQILIGSTSGTVGATGTATSNNVGDCIELVCITAGASTVWRAVNLVGTWTLA